MARNSLRRLNTSRLPADIPPQADQLPADIRRLLHERDNLQSRMQSLTGQGEQDGDARFPVTPLPVRRAADAAWATARERQRRLGVPQDDRDEPVAGSVAPDRQAADIGDPAERTGQRAIRDLSQRTGLRGLRDLDATPVANPLVRVLPRDATALRDPVPILAEPRDRSPDLPERGLRDRAEVLERGAQRLDILRGGSGDLDALRALAQSRRTARREQAQALERRRSKRDPDANRDAARLDGRAKCKREEG